MTEAQPKIVIVGAGPSGLLTAHYLAENGYKDVLVLEKNGRVGGLVKSVTWEGKSFDLGANYVTPAYEEILNLQRKLRMKLYSEEPFNAMKVPEDPSKPVKVGPLIQAMRVVPGRIKKAGYFELCWAALRYTIIRWRLASIIDKPTFAGIEKHPELAEVLETWLENNNLTVLTSMFQLPVTLMGFGSLHKTPTMYALKFMTVKSWVWMGLKEVPVLGKFIGWPKRFQLGFQRFFESLSWELNVRLNIDIKKIDREDGKIKVTYQQTKQDMSETKKMSEETLEADHLILACPLVEEVTRKLLTKLSDSENHLFPQIKRVSYCMTTYDLKELKFGDHNDEAPLLAIYPVEQISETKPVVNYGVAKQWKNNGMTQFYTRTLNTNPQDSVEESVRESVASLIHQMDGKMKGDFEPDSFDRWLYFQHVNTESINDGWYTKLENMQGENNTYYVGGATNFELIEPIACYAKNLVETHFPTIR